MESKSTGINTANLGNANNKDNSQTTSGSDTTNNANLASSSLTSGNSGRGTVVPYTHNTSVTISLTANYSKYRKMNSKVLDRRNDYIGSSVNSSRILSSNDDEIKAYFPKIVGVSFNNDMFLTRVKGHLNNIRVAVDGDGLKIDTSFYYRNKEDFEHVQRELARIDATFSKVNRGNIEDLKKAVKAKILEINALESTKHTMGYPLNTDDYILYRHCLLYNDIAKDVALINSDKNYRFYFKDDAKEAEKFAQHRQEINKAKINYVNCLADSELFESVYIQFCVDSNIQVIPALAESTMAKEVKLDKFSVTDPAKFNAHFNNKDIKLMGIIEKLIGRGELHRSLHNQNISTSDGTHVGANIKEATTWFKNPDNNTLANALIMRLNNM